MARMPDDNLTIANQHFRCTDCGRCCRDWYVALLPDWWDVERPDEPVDALAAFWGGHEG